MRKYLTLLAALCSVSAFAVAPAMESDRYDQIHKTDHGPFFNPQVEVVWFPELDSCMTSLLAEFSAPVTMNIDFDVRYGVALEMSKHFDGTVLNMVIDSGIKYRLGEPYFLRCGLRSTSLLQSPIGVGIMHLHPSIGYNANENLTIEIGALISPLTSKLHGIPVSFSYRF